MPVPDFSTKVWKKTRPDSLKDSGIAKAIAKFEKTCKHDASRLVEASDFIAYSDAINLLDDAIKTAQKKTKSKGSHDEVKELLADWKQQLDRFRREIDEANELAREATEQSIYNDNLRKAVNEFHLVLKNNIENGFAKIERALKAFTKAVKEKDLTIAALQYDVAQSGLGDVEQGTSAKEVKFQRNIYAKQFNVKKTDMDEPAEMKKWRRDLKKYDTMVDKLDRAFAILEEEVMNSDPDPQDGDAETKRVLKEVQQRYKEIANIVKGKVAPAKKFVRDAKTFLGVCEHPNLTADATTNLDRAVQSGQQINQGMLDLEQDIAEVLNETRNRSSPVRKRAIDAGITERDQETILKPFMNVTYKNNKAVLVQLRIAKAAVEEGLETLIERFDFDPAKVELKKIKDGDYKVRTGLG